jgi:hypothetical protein
MNGLVYRAFDITNGEPYVGQVGALGKTFEDRKSEHLSSKDNVPFHNALQKRPQAFVWSILTTGLRNQKELDDAEIYWGLYFNCLRKKDKSGGYNLRLGQGRTIWSEEEKFRMSEIQKIAQNRPGVKQHQSEIQKIACARPDVKEKRSQAQLIAQNKPEAKERAKIKQTIVQNTPENIEKLSVSNREARKRPETIEKHRRAQLLKNGWVVLSDGRKFESIGKVMKITGEKYQEVRNKIADGIYHREKLQE